MDKKINQKGPKYTKQDQKTPKPWNIQHWQYPKEKNTLPYADELLHKTPNRKRLRTKSSSNDPKQPRNLPPPPKPYCHNKHG